MRWKKICSSLNANTAFYEPCQRSEEPEDDTWVLDWSEGHH